jgi:hypothetical protein
MANEGEEHRRVGNYSGKNKNSSKILSIINRYDTNEMSNSWYNPNYDPSSDLMFNKPPPVIANSKDVDIDPSFTSPEFQQAMKNSDQSREKMDYNEQLILLRDVANSTQNYAHLSPQQQYLLQEKMMQDQVQRYAQTNMQQASAQQSATTQTAQEYAAKIRIYEQQMADYHRQKAAYDAYMYQMQQQNRQISTQQFQQQQQDYYSKQQQQQLAQQQRMMDPRYAQQVYYNQHVQQSR